MKDATGELSMTAIAVVAIAAVAGIFTLFVYPRIRSTLIGSTKCQGAICDCGPDNNADKCKCEYYDDNGNLVGNLECPNPNKQNGNANVNK
jgi:hypothetical protein